VRNVSHNSHNSHPRASAAAAAALAAYFASADYRATVLRQTAEFEEGSIARFRDLMRERFADELLHYQLEHPETYSHAGAIAAAVAA
jgi:hypothetical protein